MEVSQRSVCLQVSQRGVQIASQYLLELWVVLYFQSSVIESWQFSLESLLLGQSWSHRNNTFYHYQSPLKYIFLFFYLADFLLSRRKCFKEPPPPPLGEVELSWALQTPKVTEIATTTREINILDVSAELEDIKYFLKSSFTRNISDVNKLCTN